MLGFLLDEQISHVVMEQVRQKQHEIKIESVLVWNGGHLRGKDDLDLECGGASFSGCHKSETFNSTPYFRPVRCLNSWVHYTFCHAAQNRL
jgi:hypothetical protein